MNVCSSLFFFFLFHSVNIKDRHCRSDITVTTNVCNQALDQKVLSTTYNAVNYFWSHVVRRKQAVLALTKRLPTAKYRKQVKKMQACKLHPAWELKKKSCECYTAVRKRTSGENSFFFDKNLIRSQVKVNIYFFSDIF